MKLFYPIIFVFLTMGSFSPGLPESTSKAPLVYTQIALKKTLYDSLTYPARVVSKVNATILAEADGVVSKILSPLGQAVKRNSVVLVLTNPDPVYQYAPMKVRSPVSGLVSSVDITEGSHVSKGQKLATVTDPNQLKITMEVSASDVGSLKPNLEGILELPGEDLSIPVRVLGVSPFVDPATGTAPSELSLAGESKDLTSLFPGRVGRVKFKVREHIGFEFPESAVLYKADKTFLRVVQNGKAKFVNVTLGKTRHGAIEITKGITADNVVVVRTSSFVSDGEAVTVEKSQTENP